jgi:hypothetical protein
MITKETAMRIVWTYQELENSQKLIDDMAERLAKDADKTYPNLYNAFGERKGLKLGVPSGDNGHQLFDVNADLAVKIIEKHIEDKQDRLRELMALATIELKAKPTTDEK